jgi:hypothetical protein
MAFSNEELATQNLHIRAPQAGNILGLASSTTHAAMAFPAGWAGKLVTIQVYGTATKSIWVLASTDSSAEVDRTVAAAADGGPDTTRGKRILVGESTPFRLQAIEGGETLYLINESDDATTTAEIWLSSY